MVENLSDTNIAEYWRLRYALSVYELRAAADNWLNKVKLSDRGITSFAASTPAEEPQGEKQQAARPTTEP